MKKFCHVGFKKDIELIKRANVLDNKFKKDENLSFGGLSINLKLPSNEYVPIRAFLWDIDKMIESNYYVTFPTEKIINMISGHIDVSNLACIAFQVRNLDDILDQYRDDKYIESFSISPLKITNIIDIDIDEACTEIFGMEKPYKPWTADSFMGSIRHLIGKNTYHTKVVRK